MPMPTPGRRLGGEASYVQISRIRGHERMQHRLRHDRTQFWKSRRPGHKNLTNSVSAINDDFLAEDIFRRVRRQENRGLGNVFRLPKRALH